MFSLSVLALLACEEGQDGPAVGLVPIHTAGWAANEAMPLALDWLPDAVLLGVASDGDVNGDGSWAAADGTALGWMVYFGSPSAGAELHLRVGTLPDVARGIYEYSFVNDCAWEGGCVGGEPMSDWKVNSDEVADIVRAEQGFDGTLSYFGFCTDSGEMCSQMARLYHLPHGHPMAWANTKDNITFEVDAATGELLGSR